MSVSSKASSPVGDAPRVLAPLAPSSMNGSGGLPTTLASIPPGPVQKEWIVPPRPKPGRKPATDIPPTKRKAQNRAAQRAFRERRASKVGELEDQMKIMEEEDEREQEALREQITKLETDVERYRQLLIAYEERMKAMESELYEERDIKESVQRELVSLRNSASVSTDDGPLPSRNSGSPKVSQSSPNAIDLEASATEAALGCGNCNVNSRCECIEQAFDMGNLEEIVSDPTPKRPHTPTISTENKRLCRGNEAIKHELEENEIDFTTTKPLPQLTTSSSTCSIPAPAPTSSMMESCGFCQDGSPCLCAAIADGAPSISRENDRQIAHLLSQPSDMSKYVTPASLPSFSYSRSSTSGDSCANGPGTCKQCQTDPNSTLFCKSLAATRCETANLNDPNTLATQQPAPPPCDNPNGCCRNATSNVQSPFSLSLDRSATHAITGPTLSCADAFTTLSRHPAFDRASEELGQWLPQLATVPQAVGKSAFEIEAASVMGVLRFFNRRFGKEGNGSTGGNVSGRK